MDTTRLSWRAKHSQFGKDPEACEYCHWVEISFKLKNEQRYFDCYRPGNFLGQAREGRGCCDFRREPGSDDDLIEHRPGLHVWVGVPWFPEGS